MGHRGGPTFPHRNVSEPVLIYKIVSGHFESRKCEKEINFDMELSISSEYGLVIIVICMTWFLLNWLESRSFQARRRYEVPVSRDKFARIKLLVIEF